MGDGFVVLGAGRQGTAAGYDLAARGGLGQVVFADVDGTAARAAAARVEGLLGAGTASAAVVDVADGSAVRGLLEPFRVCVAAVPYRFLLGVTEAAVAAGTGMVDLGGHTDTVLRQWDLDGAARAAGVTVVPDCGMGPGLNNTLGLYAMELLQAGGGAPQDVRLWDGGLPQQPPEPWGYQCSFDIEGLINEYDGRAVFLRDGERVLVDTFADLEELDFEGIGRLEAFVTSGGTSTLPYTMAGMLQVYENKTLRYPGHAARFAAFRDAGLFDDEPVVLPGGEVVSPRRMLATLLRPELEVDRVVDVCVMRARASGERDGAAVAVVVDLVDRYDPASGFTAMERLTGWHAAIMAGFIARGDVPAGVVPLEKAVTASRFVAEVRARGIDVTERWEE
jgi:lysine 6-dehydrogenase